MIIDIHCHMREENKPSKYYWDNIVVKLGVELSGSPEEVVRERSRQSCDRTGDLLVQDMNEAGIDKSVLLVIDRWFLVGTGPSESLDEEHQVYAEAVRSHPDRLILFCGIDPRRAEASKFVERAVKEWDAKGLKLMPCYGFYPNDISCYPIYEKCCELDIPVLVHTGPEGIPAYSMYGQPIYLDQVANDFPELKIIMAHAGGCWWPEAAAHASMKPNIYLDISWWQPRLLRHPVDEFYRPLRSLIDNAGRSKILFGSDWPGLRLIRRLPHSAWVKAIKEIPQEVKEAGIEFSEAEINGILGGNAAALLKM